MGRTKNPIPSQSPILASPLQKCFFFRQTSFLFIREHYAGNWAPTFSDSPHSWHFHLHRHMVLSSKRGILHNIYIIYIDESARGIAQKRHVFLSPPASVASLRLQQDSRALWTIMNAAATMLYSGTCMTTPMSFFQIFTPSMGGCHTIFFLPVLPSVFEFATESNSCRSIVLAWTPSNSFQIHRKVHGHSNLTLGLSGLIGAKSAFQPHQIVSELCI